MKKLSIEEAREMKLEYIEVIEIDSKRGHDFQQNHEVKTADFEIWLERQLNGSPASMDLRNFFILAPDEPVYKQYRRKSISEMCEWFDGMDMTGVSISEADLKAGSPKQGDMIARNPKNHNDMWLVAKAYFEENLEPLN